MVTSGSPILRNGNMGIKWQLITSYKLFRRGNQQQGSTKNMHMNHKPRGFNQPKSDCHTYGNGSKPSPFHPFSGSNCSEVGDKQARPWKLCTWQMARCVQLCEHGTQAWSLPHWAPEQVPWVSHLAATHLRSTSPSQWVKTLLPNVHPQNEKNSLYYPLCTHVGDSKYWPIPILPSGKLTVCYWKCLIEIVDLPRG